MNKKLSKKLQIKLAELALKHSYAYGGNWDSSAKDLEKQLKKLGVNNIKLFYTYKMPYGKTPQEYMAKLALYCLFLNFDLYNKNDDYGFQTDFKNLVPNGTDRLNIVDYIEKNSKTYDAELVKDYQELIDTNPELAQLSNRQDKHQDILWGAVFGFAPEEIEYYCYGRFNQGQDIDNVLDDERKMQDVLKKYGVKSGYVLAPQTAEKIISVLEKNKQNAMMNKNEREIK